MTMYKYVFELYKITGYERYFKGYKTVVADSTETALASASDGLPEDYILLPIYVPQDS